MCPTSLPLHTMARTQQSALKSTGGESKRKPLKKPPPPKRKDKVGLSNVVMRSLSSPTSPGGAGLSQANNPGPDVCYLVSGCLYRWLFFSGAIHVSMVEIWSFVTSAIVQFVHLGALNYQWAGTAWKSTLLHVPHATISTTTERAQHLIL